MIKPKPLISNMWRPAPDASARSDIYRFDRNERTTVFTDEELNKIFANVTAYDLVAYGELEPFYSKVSSFFGINRENILLTSQIKGVLIKQLHQVQVVSHSFLQH